MWGFICAVGFMASWARLFYSWGFENGKRYHSERAEEMLRREGLRAILDPPPTVQRQPLHLFGSTRPDIKRIK